MRFTWLWTGFLKIMCIPVSLPCQLRFGIDMKTRYRYFKAKKDFRLEISKRVANLYHTEKSEIKLFKINQFRHKLQEFRVSTFWMSGISKDSRRRPTQPVRLVSFKSITARHIRTIQKTWVLARQGPYAKCQRRSPFESSDALAVKCFEI